MPSKRFLLASLFSLLILFLTFMAGFLAHGQLLKEKTRFPVLVQAYEILNNYSLQPLPEPAALEYGMVRGMLQASGDPYALFLEPPMHELETNSLEGNFGGIGVELVRDDEGRILLYPYPDSPATLAGIRPGDRLLSVDELAIAPETPIEAIQAAIRGNIGQKVKLKIIHKNESTPLEIEVSRKEMPLPSVTWRLHPAHETVGIIKINIIAASTPDEIVRAVQELEDQGASHFILDLQDNGGGLLTESINISRLFLEKGEVLQQQYRGEPIQSFSVENPGSLANIDLAVVVNQNTASAAEIIAGALKANHRAPIIGTPTYGKDTIQLVFNLDDGSSMHITSARWWIPGLDPPVGGHGIQPDVVIAPDQPEADQVLNKAAELLINGP